MSRSTVFGRGPEKDLQRFRIDSTRARLRVPGLPGKRDVTPTGGASDAQVAVLQAAIRRQLGRDAAPDDAAFLEDVVPVGDARQGVQILVYDQDREARGLQLLDRAVDLDADQRRQALRGLVEDEHPRIGHQRAPDRKHLLLAAGELAAEVPAPLGELREEREYARQRPRLGGP